MTDIEAIPDDVYVESVLISIPTEKLITELKKRLNGYCPLCGLVTVEVEQ